MNQYRNHDPMAILLSPEYMKHISAMTGEDLHGKAEIAEELAARDIQIAKLKRPDFSEMREMLRAMQAGELTVSRGIELLEMWSAGNYSDDMLPPVRHDLIEEDSMPVEIIDRLKVELVESIEVRTVYLSEIGTMQSQLTALKVELARSQADFNDALTELNALKAQPTQSGPVQWRNLVGHFQPTVEIDGTLIELDDLAHRLKQRADADSQFAAKFIETIYTTPQPASEPCDRQCSEYQNAECPGDPGKQCCMEKPAQGEPVAWMYQEDFDDLPTTLVGHVFAAKCKKTVPLYATPQPSADDKTVELKRFIEMQGRIIDKLESQIEHLRLSSFRRVTAPQPSAEVVRLTKQRDELIQALEYHQEQTRPIQRTIDLLAHVRSSE